MREVRKNDTAKDYNVEIPEICSGFTEYLDLTIHLGLPLINF
jgi:hypothetical protein